MAQTNWSSLGIPGPLTRSTASPIVAQNADGCLEAFLGPQDVDAKVDALWHIWQTSPGGGWSAWASLNWPTKISVGSFDVGRNADGRLEIFISGSDGALWHTWQTTAGGSWNNTWFSLGQLSDGVGAGGIIDVVTNTDGRLEVFTPASDGAFWHIGQIAPNGTWSSWSGLGMWSSLGMVNLGYPVAARNADGRLEVFTCDSGGMIWYIGQMTAGGNWYTNWLPLGQPSTTSGPAQVTPPVVSQNADGRLEVFTTIWDTLDGAIWHKSQTSPNGTWSDWSSLGGPTTTRLTSLLTVGRNADGRLEVLVPGNDGALWHSVQTSPGGSWSTWDSLGAPPSTSIFSSPVVVENTDGRLEIFAIANGTLWHARQVAPGGPWG
jgi:hypothetical protein